MSTGFLGNDSPYPYPYIECEVHGKQFGYAVCIHIENDEAPVYHVMNATEDTIGRVFCKVCTVKAEMDLEMVSADIVLACEASLRAEGKLTPSPENIN